MNAKKNAGKNRLADKKLVVFDLDGTLTKTKSNLESDMSDALRRLLEKKKVAVIGGGSYAQFRKQLLANLKCPKPLLKNLYLFPTTATAFYEYRSGWKRVYFHKFTKAEEKRDLEAFREALKEVHYKPKKVYGKLIEDRGSQITFSALGQDVVAKLGARGVHMKENWIQKNKPLKAKIASLIHKMIPDEEVHAAGFTSIDVTRKGINKAYGVRQIRKHLDMPIKNMVFVGDALFRGGNDYAARRTGVRCIPVKGPEDTLRVIERVLR